MIERTQIPLHAESLFCKRKQSYVEQTNIQRPRTKQNTFNIFLYTYIYLISAVLTVIVTASISLLRGRPPVERDPIHRVLRMEV